METKYFSATLQKLKEMVVFLDSERTKQNKMDNSVRKYVPQDKCTDKKLKKENKKCTVDDFNWSSYATGNNKQGNHISKRRWGRGTPNAECGCSAKVPRSAALLWLAGHPGTPAWNPTPSWLLPSLTFP